MLEASVILTKHHANNVSNDPLVLWELNEIESAIKQERTHNKVSYLDFYRTRGNRRRLIVLLSLCIGTNWVGNGIIS